MIDGNGQGDVGFGNVVVASDSAINDPEDDLVFYEHDDTIDITADSMVSANLKPP